MIAVALTAVALSASVPVAVTGGTGAERAIVRRALRGADRGVVGSAAIDRRGYLVLRSPGLARPGVRQQRALWEASAVIATAGRRLAGQRWARFLRA